LLEKVYNTFWYGGVLKLTKNLILKTSFNYINENGIENFSMRQVATVLDCAAPSIYHHFASKEVLFNELFLMITEKLYSKIDVTSNTDENIKSIYFVSLKNRQEYLFVQREQKSKLLSTETKNILKKKASQRQKYFLKQYNLTIEDADTIYFLIFGPLHELINLNVQDQAIIDNITTFVTNNVFNVLERGKVS